MAKRKNTTRVTKPVTYSTKDTKKELIDKLNMALGELNELKRIHAEMCKELREERKEFRELLAKYTARLLDQSDSLDD